MTANPRTPWRLIGRISRRSWWVVLLVGCGTARASEQRNVYRVVVDHALGIVCYRDVFVNYRPSLSCVYSPEVRRK